MLREDDDGWSNPKVLTIFALIFLCGLAAGAAITRSYLHSRMAGDGVTATMDAARRYGVTRLKTELSLTPVQEKTIMQVWTITGSITKTSKMSGRMWLSMAAAAF